MSSLVPPTLLLVTDLQLQLVPTNRSQVNLVISQSHRFVSYFMSFVSSLHIVLFLIYKYVKFKSKFHTTVQTSLIFAKHTKYKINVQRI